MAHDVFISYEKNDKNLADSLCSRLEARSIRCWYAPRDVFPGQSWGEAIIDGIDQARVLVVVFSSHSNGSTHVLSETERAVSKGRHVIPFRIEDVIPSKSFEFFMSSRHWLDALTPPIEKHIDHLADTIDVILQRPLQQRPLASRQRARRPVLFGIGVLIAAGGVAAWLVLWEPGTNDTSGTVSPPPAAKGESGSGAPSPEARKHGPQPKAAAPTVVVDTEPNNSQSEASPIAEGVSVPGEVAAGKDTVDWYRFLAPADGSLKGTLKNHHPGDMQKGSLQPLRILDAMESERGTTAYSVLPGLGQSTYGFPVSAGLDYFISVTAAEGDAAPYTLTLSFEKLQHANDQEPNDDKREARLIDVKSSERGLVGYGKDTVDWYRFLAPADGSLKGTLKNHHPGDMQKGSLQPLRILDAMESERGTTAYSVLPGYGQSTYVFPVSAGLDYFISVTAAEGDAAPYTLTLSFEKLQHANDQEPNDDKREARLIDVKSSERGLVGYGKDTVDWYRFLAPADGSLKGTLKNHHPGDMQNGSLQPLRILDAMESERGTTAYEVLPGLEQVTHEFPVTAGAAYFVVVAPKSHCAAPYKLDLVFTPK